MAGADESDPWVMDWIAGRRAAGERLEARRDGRGYAVYRRTVRRDPATGALEKVSVRIGGLSEASGFTPEPEGPPETSPVRYGLGIDTGGTYTDAAIIDLDDRSVVAKRKSPTTHHDLLVGLYEAVDSLFASADVAPSEISLVGISTTLATNSVLEGKGGEVGLIFIGWDPMEPVSFGERSQAFVSGGYDVRGRAAAAMRREEVEAAIAKVSQGADAIAISGMFSNVNAAQERKVKELVMKSTGLPTVAGHELSAELGVGLRAQTAVLNGKLIPIVSRFFDGVQETFLMKGIQAPIMVYKGDGSVMTLEKAKMYPVETILSGPAASAMGGMMLSGYDGCVVVDIGGTSTDIAVIEGGFPQMQYMGAEIGGWRTRVKAVDMLTVALGGDSRITMDGSRFVIGPERAVPLCEFAAEHPEVVSKTLHSNQYEYYFADESGRGARMTERQRRIFDGMRGKGPLTLLDAMNVTDGIWDIADDVEAMRREGALTLASLTPTDVMVYLGMFPAGDPEGARAAVHAVAARFGMAERQAAEAVMEEVRSSVAEAVLSKLIGDAVGRSWRCPETEMLVRRMSSLPDGSDFRIGSALRIPVVGVGAPAAHMMSDIGERLGARAVFPRDHEVGNAVGAVSSKVVESLSATVTPTHDYRFRLDMPYLGPSYYSRIDSAVSAAKRSLESFLEDAVRKHGGTNIRTSSKVRTFTAKEGGVGNWEDDAVARTVNYIEVSSRAVGDPPEAPR